MNIANEPNPAELRDGDIETIDNRGQWMNRVFGKPELSESFASREEAVEAGRALAQQLGHRHVVRESDPTGAITDPDEASGGADPDEAPAGADSAEPSGGTDPLAGTYDGN